MQAECLTSVCAVAGRKGAVGVPLYSSLVSCDFAMTSSMS